MEGSLCSFERYICNSCGSRVFSLFLAVITPGIHSQDARPQRVRCVGLIDPDRF